MRQGDSWRQTYQRITALDRIHRHIFGIRNQPDDSHQRVLNILPTQPISLRITFRVLRDIFIVINWQASPYTVFAVLYPSEYILCDEIAFRC
jgi:hypothetical protein